MNPRTFAGTALLLAVFVGDAAAQKTRPARPAGKSIEVEVMRGGSVRIPLRGYERNLNRLEYNVIGSPRFGRLSRVEQYNGSERQGPGYVTYTHGNDENSMTDTFAFEVTAPTKMTGRGRITIRIIDSPAELQIAPATLDFGTTAIGDTPVRRTVELANVGGGVIQGFLEVPEPFALAEDGMFVLRRGGKVRIPIIFAPQRAGPYVFPVQPMPGDPAVLTLKGEALQPFDVEADEAEFREQSDQSRTARVVLKNQSQIPQTISVILPADSPIEPVPAFEVPPGGSREIVFRIPSGTKTRVAPFDVRFESAGHAVLLGFQAPPVPPEVIVLSPPDFGTVKPGTAAKAPLILSNSGGAVAQCLLQSAKNLTTEDGAPAFSIAPGSTHNIALKLMPKKGQDLPTELLVKFRERELTIPVSAIWAPAEVEKEESTTGQTNQIVYPPSEVNLALNTTIQIKTEKDGVFITYPEREGWTNVVLLRRPANADDWTNYQMTPPHEGILARILAWIRNLARRIQNRLETPIQRPQVEGMEPEEPSLARIEIAPEEVNGPNLWRLVATPSGQPDARPVSDVFRITSDRLLAVETPAPVAQSTPAPATPQPPKIAPPTVGPVTEIASAGIRSERNSALLQVAFAQSLGVRGFRLERGAMVARIDPKTGIPQASEFNIMDPPQAEVELLGLAEAEVDGKKFTVCLARISGLDEGSRTYWRIVPAGAKGDLPPTSVIFVDTLPRPPFPWNSVLLVSLFLLLGGVLYLRWRMNRPPA